MQVNIEIRTKVRLELGDELDPQLYQKSRYRTRWGHFGFGISNEHMLPFVVAAKAHLQGLLAQKGVDMLCGHVEIVLEDLSPGIR